MRNLLHDWESVDKEPAAIQKVVRCALMHYQIAAIDPYTDYSGRIGRLLITLFLCVSENVIPRRSST